MSEIEELKAQVAELQNTVNSMTALLKNQNGMQLFPKTVMSALYNDDGTKYRLVKQVSWAEYQALEQEGKVSTTTIYDITDRPFIAMASMIGFDDSVTQLGQNTVQGAIEKNSSDISVLNNNLDVLALRGHSLIMRDTLSTTEKVFNTYDNRKFSDYKFIIIRWGLGTDLSSLNTRNTAIIDNSNWRAGASYTTTCLHGSDSQVATNYNVATLGVTYNSDTSVKAKIGGSGSINVFDIIGYKFDKLRGVD